MQQLTPDQVVPCLLGELSLDDGDYECEGMAVARIDGGTVIAVACDGPGHGWHQRYSDMLGSFYEKFGDKVKRALPHECEKCDGTGWLPADSPEAQGQVTICMSIGMFRGIQITGGLKGKVGHANLLRFLDVEPGKGGESD